MSSSDLPKEKKPIGWLKTKMANAEAGCGHCGRKQEGGHRLKPCSACASICYCDTTCQRNGMRILSSSSSTNTTTNIINTTTTSTNTTNSLLLSLPLYYHHRHHHHHQHY
jgi:hypothetical protein